MIPKHLSLKNFFSYREASLDFEGLHSACICGANGAGKSSLLEAIAWSLWGQSRASTEDDLIRLGEDEARVSFTFYSRQNCYRVIRRHRRGQSSSLEFQVETAEGQFRSLTEKGLRATQQKIVEDLKLDYKTFINSAYLRQGHADDFMTQTPKERKQILANLLDLDRYEDLAEKAKDRAKTSKATAEVLSQALEATRSRLETGDSLATERANVEDIVDGLQQQLDSDRATERELQNRLQQRQNWQQQLQWQRQQLVNLDRDRASKREELANLQRQQQQLETLLAEEETIVAGRDRYQKLQAEEENYAAKAQADREARERRSHLRDRLHQEINQLQGQQQQVRAHLDALDRQESEIQAILGRSNEIEAGLVELQAASDRLAQLDALQAEVSPLLQQRDRLQLDIDRDRSRLQAQLEQLQLRQQSLERSGGQKIQIQQELGNLGLRIKELEKQQVYFSRLEEKGRERRSFLDQLEGRKQDYDRRLQDMDKKLQMLRVPDATCPLCDRPLDDAHWQLVEQKHHGEQQELLEHLWVIKGQIAASDVEIKELRREYSAIKKQLAEYDALRERRGQLQANLASCDEEAKQASEVKTEIDRVREIIQSQNYALEKRQELQQLNARLVHLDYDEKNHALARGNVDRLRWVQIKNAELQSARKKQEQIQIQRPQLLSQLETLAQQRQVMETESELAKQIRDIETAIASQPYNREEHEAVRSALKEHQIWLTKVEQLRSAKEQHPQLIRQQETLSESLQQRQQDYEAIAREVANLEQQLKQLPDPSADIARIQQQIQQKRRELDNRLAELGRLQQQQQELIALQKRYQSDRQTLANARYQENVYKELSQAFGKNGIQALTIENVLPQLEAETNRILSQLSANQLHVQFITQRARKGSKKTTKLIDTLEILIADARGTRPYETYSGGESFRIDFAIRLALSKLLAQRSGAALQMLIIDEGFGTQDERGCERLVAAIQAIAPEFACILAVTHVPHLKELFDNRIEVRKTEMGSQISIT